MTTLDLLSEATIYSTFDAGDIECAVYILLNEITKIRNEKETRLNSTAFDDRI